MLERLLGQVGLRFQIGLIGLIGVVIIILVAALTLAGIRYQEQRQQVADTAAMANDLVSSVGIGMLSARRHEKDYFLRNDDKYVAALGQALRQVDQALEKLRGIIRQPEALVLIDSLKSNVNRYSDQFAEVAALRNKLGLNENAGLMGQMRTAVHAIEDAVKVQTDPQLQILMLTMRRHEKDFLARKDIKYVDGLKGAADQFLAALDSSGIPDVTRADVRARVIADVRVRLIEYRNGFLGVVEATRAIADASRKLAEIYAEIEPVQQALDEKNVEAYEKARTDIAAARADMVVFLMWVLGGGIVVMIAAGLVISAAVCRPLIGLTDVMKQLAFGNLDVIAGHLDRRNEIGDMAKAILVFKDNATEKKRMDAADAARLEAERKAEEFQRQREQAVGGEIAALIAAVAKGDLSSRIDLVGKEGFYATMSEGINRLTDTVEGAIGDIGRVLNALADGDLTQRITKDYQGAFNYLKEDVNTTSAKLAEIMTKLDEASEAISAASEEVSTGSGDLAERTEQQASSLEETAASLEQLGATVRTSAEHAQHASAMAGEARKAAEQGGTVANEAIDAMKAIAGASRRITDIIGVIDEIVFQTNLLALNAAVEAARAGDAGRGFAVVAQEVRMLAQRSAQASKEIKTLILDSDSQVRHGVDLVGKAGSSLSGIVHGVQQVAALISEIAAAGSEQSSALDEINTAVAAMDEMTQKNAALVEETTAAAHTMSGQASDLREQMAFFCRA